MSAFIVDYKTIDNILSIRLNSDVLTQHCYLKSEFETLFDNYAGYTRDYLIYDNLEALGKEFLRLNIASVNARYPQEEEPMDYADFYKFNSIDNISIAQALKSLNCLMYQSCEQDDYKQNPVWQKMEKLKAYLTDAFIQLNDEYKNAEWSDTY